jgi:hypothetical protein
MPRLRIDRLRGAGRVLEESALLSFENRSSRPLEAIQQLLAAQNIQGKKVPQLLVASGASKFGAKDAFRRPRGFIAQAA